MRTYPTFTRPGDAPPEWTLSKKSAAARLDVSHAQLLDKLWKSGLLDLDLDGRMNAAAVDKLAAMEWLEIVTGEVTILRTSGRTVREGSNRELGVHLSMEDGELDLTTLKWWRGDAERIVANGLFVATVATFPFAIWELDEDLNRVTSKGTGTDLRHSFTGELVARLKWRDELEDGDVILSDLGLPYLAVVPFYAADGLDDERLRVLQTLMSHRIRVEAGGPIGYLTGADA